MHRSRKEIKRRRKGGSPFVVPILPIYPSSSTLACFPENVLLCHALLLPPPVQLRQPPQPPSFLSRRRPWKNLFWNQSCVIGNPISPPHKSGRRSVLPSVSIVGGCGCCGEGKKGKRKKKMEKRGREEGGGSLSRTSSSLPPSLASSFLLFFHGID